MKPEGGCCRRPCTGEPFTVEPVAVFHEGRDAAEGELQECHVKAEGRQIESLLVLAVYRPIFVNTPPCLTCTL